jgi:hypothetical protein
VLVQKIVSKDCSHTSERDESFFSIQCEVKDKKNLYESLQLYEKRLARRTSNFANHVMRRLVQ